MKLAAFCLTCFLSTASAGTLYSQSARISLDMRNASVEQVLQEIEESSEFYFMYNSKLVNVDRKVNIKVKDKSIETILNEICKAANIEYSVNDKQIILRPKSMGANATQQKTKTIKGIVNDQLGPITGANVSVNGTTIGTITDMDGRFTLEVPENATLQVSFIGYLTQNIKVAGQTDFTINMKEDTQKLDEVVVVGYGTQKKVNLTGAITSVKAEELNQIPVSNLSNSLAGRAPGVTVTTSSGMAGASSKIRMRGSFGEPLYVINNVIREKADFDALDPNEVENISFLKDAASASIYGSKAGNGVVLVTTKKGKEQKPMFQYKGTFSTSKTTRPLQDYSATDELIWANRVSQTKGLEPAYGQEIFDYFKDKSYNVNDYVWRNPSSQQHNISVNGGNERIAYYMLLGYHDENGSYKNLDFKKFNFRSDITANISKRFKVNFNLSGNQRNYNRFYWPYDGVDDFNVPDFYRTTFNWTRLYPFYVDDAGNPTTDTNANPITQGSWNPVDMVLGNRYQKTIRRTIDGQIRFDLDLGQFVDGLSTAFMGQYTAYDENYKGFLTHNKGYRFQSASASNKFIPGPVNPNDMVIHNLSSNYEGIRESAKIDHSYQINVFLQYNKVFNKKHAVSGLLVYEQAESGGKNLSGKAENMLTTSIDQIFASSSDTQYRYFSGNEWENARQSIVGRFNYTFDNKYIAEFSFREDGNYKFAPGHRWGFFPSGSIGWRISEESFMDNLSWLSNLKLRGSYGATGDDKYWNSGDEIAAFQWSDIYTGGSGYVFGDSYANGLTTGRTPNPYITWAKLEVYDVGLDFGFLDNRLSGEFDYFYKNKNHILKSRINVVPGTYGASLPEENYAEQQWHGAEISLKWADSYKDFNYSISANLGYAKDKWTILDEAEGLEDWRRAVGRPNDRVSGYICEGIIRTQEQLDALPEGFTQFGRKPILGTLLYKDIRGANYAEGADGKIDGNDATFLSDNGKPRINYGVGINLSWRGFTIDALFQGVGGYDRMISTKNGGGVFQVGDKPYFELWTGDVWTPENPNAKYPRVSGQWQAEYGAAGSTYWLRNGAYLRLKNLNIGYTLPKQWFSSIGVDNVQLFLTGTNLFSIDGIDEMDPEQETLDSYPLMKTFTGGLSINF